MNTVILNKEQGLRFRGYEIKIFTPDCEYSAGVGLELHKFKSVPSNIVCRKMLSCFNMYNIVKNSITHLTNYGIAMNETTLSVDAYIKEFGSLNIYVPMLDGNEYKTVEIKISTEDELYQLIDDIGKIDERLISSVTRMVYINKGNADDNTANMNRAFDDYVVRSGMYMPEKKFNEFIKANNIDKDVVDAWLARKCSDDAMKNVVYVYDIDRNSHDCKIVDLRSDVVNVCGKLYRIIRCF